MTIQYVVVGEGDRPSPQPRKNPRTIAAGAMIFACCAVALLALSSNNSDSINNDASFAEKSAWLQDALAQQQFDMLQATNGTAAAPAAAAAASAHAAYGNSTSADQEDSSEKFFDYLKKIRFPRTWESLHETFGGHLYWTLFILFCGGLTWAYIYFIRPRLQKGPEAEDSPDLDENNVADKIIQLEGVDENILFESEEPFSANLWEVILCGCGNRVWKMAVTNKRIVAQKRESTCFGTCQLTAREDAWPIENVSKVSVISGEFWGYTIPALWDMAGKYLAITLVFDLAHGIVRETLQDMFGPTASDPDVAKVIALVNVAFYVLCNVLFILAVIYSLAVMSLLIWPHSLVKVYLTRDMEDEGSPLNACCACCGTPNSKPMEAFTFKTLHAYKAYQCIMSARAGAMGGKV